MKNSQLGELPVLPQALHPQNAPGPALPFLTWSILQVGYVFLIPHGLFLIPAGLFLFPDLFRAGSCCRRWMRWGKVIKPQIFGIKGVREGSSHLSSSTALKREELVLLMARNSTKK